MNTFTQSFIKILTLAMLLVVPPMAFAADMHDHGSHGGTGKMGAMDHGAMDHGDMMKDAGMVMLGEQTVEGIKGMAHVKDVKDAMAKMGMKETHHFSVMFLNAAGKPITTGIVAVKIKDPAGREGEAIALPGMQEHFGADIVLADKGTYEFKVGTKLPDGKVRQYAFKYEVK